MVALESPAATGHAEPGRRRPDGRGWTVAAGAALLLGLALRLALVGAGVGDRSAIVMAALLAIGAWLAARLLSTPRTAFGVLIGALVLLDLAALPARNAPEYDYREAFYRTDQVVTAQVSAPPSAVGAQAQPMLAVLVEPVFPASLAQPRFGLAADVGSVAVAWDCVFQRGLQHVALPVPAVALAGSGSGSGSGSVDVRLHLTGSPSRETDYLMVYASAPRGGFLVSLVGAAELTPTTTVCALRP